MSEIQNPDTCLVLYYVSPALTAEGDEDDVTALGYVKEAFARGEVKYVGFTFPETPERMVKLSVVGENVTQLWFTVSIAVLTPFNAEADFTPGILKALGKKDGVITNCESYIDSVAMKRMDVVLTAVLDNR